MITRYLLLVVVATALVFWCYSANAQAYNNKNGTHTVFHSGIAYVISHPNFSVEQAYEDITQGKVAYEKGDFEYYKTKMVSGFIWGSILGSSVCDWTGFKSKGCLIGTVGTGAAASLIAPWWLSSESTHVDIHLGNKGYTVYD